jgi:hypothetical protein
MEKSTQNQISQLVIILSCKGKTNFLKENIFKQSYQISDLKLTSII